MGRLGLVQRDTLTRPLNLGTGSTCDSLLILAWRKQSLFLLGSRVAHQSVQDIFEQLLDACRIFGGDLLVLVGLLLGDLLGCLPCLVGDIVLQVALVADDVYLDLGPAGLPDEVDPLV